MLYSFVDRLVVGSEWHTKQIQSVPSYTIFLVKVKRVYALSD